MAGTGDRTYTVPYLQNQDVDTNPGGANTDVFLAVGKFKLSGTVTFHWHDNAITAVDINATGRDLYDFDYDFGGSDQLSAEIQAGYGTLGWNGKIFANVWHFDQAITNWSY